VSTVYYSTTYTDTSVTAGTTYYFVVQIEPYEGLPGSGDSNQASAVPLGAVPAPPANLSAVADNSSVSLTWSASSGATSYSIQQSTSYAGPFVTLGTTSNTSYVATGLSNGSWYYFTVSASNANGSSSASYMAEACPTGPMPTPTGLTATPGVGEVNLTWNGEGAYQFNIKRASVSGGPYTTLTTVYYYSSYTDSVSPGTYYYVVSALNGMGQLESPNSAEAVGTSLSQAPAAPTNLTATQGDTQISLTWTASAGAATYNVKRSTTTGGPYTAVQTGITGTTCTDTGLTDGTTYYYIVTAVNSGGESSPSNQASATPNPPPPPAPAGLTAVPGNNQVALSWTASTGAATYNVKRSLVTGGPYTTVQEGVTGTTWTDTLVSNGTTYYYIVTAVSANGESAPSSEVSGIPNPPPPPAPSGLTAAAGDTEVALSWSASEGAATYNVKRSDTSGGPYTAVQTGITGTTCTDTGLTDGNTYYYVVSAVNAGVEGSDSPEVAATPTGPMPAPTNLCATAGAGEVSLSWLGTEDTFQFNVKRALVTGGPYTTIATVYMGNGYTDTGLTIGTTYFYVLTALSASGDAESPDSNEASAVPTGFPPDAPLDLSATSGDTQVILGWTASDGADTYTVQRAETEGGPMLSVRWDRTEAA